MILTRQILIQMAIFALVATTALAIMVFGYMRLPEMLGVGQYKVTVELPETGGLSPRGNVTYRGVQPLPHDNLKPVTDEGHVAVGGLGPELRRLVNGSTQLAIDARKNLAPLTTLIDQSKPVLNSQTETAGSIQAWASNLASITSQ